MSSPKYSCLTNKNVVITGGGSGIGASLVRNFCLQGANVAFISIDDDNSYSLCEAIKRDIGMAPFFYSCDLTDVKKLRLILTEIHSRLGNINVLINNAGDDRRQAVMAMNEDDWDQSLNVNLRPHFFTMQGVIEGMKKNASGSIINLGSNASILGLTGYPAYIASKSAIVGLSKAMARELGPFGIRVNSLLPGWVMTEKQKKLWATPDTIQQCLDAQCLKSTISEQDIADAALFLASSAAKMITAQTIVVDGGRA